MPSASVSAKLEKQQSSTVASAAAEVVDNSSPIRQVLVIVEHKIRNLEKRKGKLEVLRDLEKAGKEVNVDQKVALSKYGEVAQTLEFARDLFKQIQQITIVSEKEQKKKQKKDETARKLSETSKLREVLVIQDVLNLMADDEARSDFLTGSNGACKIEEFELDLLDKFYGEVTPKRPCAPDEMPFKHAAQRSADHFSLTLEARPKPFVGEPSTYADINVVLKNINASGYFDKAAQPIVVDEVTEPVKEEEPDVAAVLAQPSETNIADELLLPQDTIAVENDASSVVVTVTAIVEPPDFQEAPAAAAVPVPTFPPQQQQQQSLPPMPTQMLPQIPLVAAPIVPVIGGVATVSLPQPNQMHPAHLAPTTVRAVEQAYFKQHQYMQQQMRPLAEVIGARNFYFLQESELDSPDVMHQQQHQQQQQQHGGYPPQQQIQQQPQVPDMSPTSQQHQQQALIIQQMSPAPQQQQQPPSLPSQAFPNPGYTNIVSAPMFAALKPGEVPQQPHIPGFATPNAPIPIPIVQPASVQQLSPQSGVTSVKGGSSNMHGAVPIAPFPTTGNFVTSPPQQQQQQQKPSTPPNQSKQQHMQPASKEVRGVQQQSQQQQQPHHQPMIPVETKVLDVGEQRVPEITEWKPEDVNKSAEEITEWRDPYQAPQEVGDWNDETTEDSNTWSNSQRLPYRSHQGGNGAYNGRNRGPSGRTVGGGVGENRNGSGENRTSSGGTTTNGYRNNRSNNSYQQNGRQSGGGGGTNPNTFYRNNESYYQNGNTGYRNAGGGDSKDTGSGSGSYRGGGGGDNSKSDYRGAATYRSRDLRENHGNGAPNRGSTGQQSRNNRYNSDSAERGTGAAASSTNQTSASSNNNNNNNNGQRVAATASSGTPSAASSRNGPVSTVQQNVRSTTTAKPSGGNAYGGGPRPSGNSRPHQGVNV